LSGYLFAVGVEPMEKPDESVQVGSS